MSDVVKNSKSISFLSFALTPLLFVAFFFLSYWYEKSVFNDYLSISKSFELDSNINYAMRTVAEIYSRSLVNYIIMPIFFAAGISCFANFIFYKRISYLETELKEIKEKLDA